MVGSVTEKGVLGEKFIDGIRNKGVFANEKIGKGNRIMGLNGAIMILWENLSTKTFWKLSLEDRRQIVSDVLETAKIDKNKLKGIRIYPFYEADCVKFPIIISMASPTYHMGCAVNVARPFECVNCEYIYTGRVEEGGWEFLALRRIAKGEEILISSYALKLGCIWDQAKYSFLM